MRSGFALCFNHKSLDNLVWVWSTSQKSNIKFESSEENPKTKKQFELIPEAVINT